MHATAKATGLADAIVNPIFRRLVDIGALTPEEPASPGRKYSVDEDSLEPVASATTWIATKVELESADVETRLWELAERDLGIRRSSGPAKARRPHFDRTAPRLARECHHRHDQRLVGRSQRDRARQELRRARASAAEYWWNVGLKPMFQSQSAPSALTINHSGGRKRTSHCGRISAVSAKSITSNPPGLNASDAPRWPCTAATHARVMPQSGHGMPVIAQRAGERRVHRQNGQDRRGAHERAGSDAQVAPVAAGPRMRCSRCAR